MADVSAFPALTRAKELFLLRKSRYTEETSRANAQSKPFRRFDSSNSSSSARVQERIGSKTARHCTASLLSFCSDFDKQLRLMNSDILMLTTSLKREYHRESLALDKLTSMLLNAEVDDSGINQKRTKHCHIRFCSRKQKMKIRTTVPSIKPKKLLPCPMALSRAAMLAHQAVKARVLQTYTRFYLYRYLYPGGPTQLVAATRLTSRNRQSRAFWRWRRIVTQRIKLRLRCHRAQQRIECCASSWACGRASGVVESEGKYAMAKEFHESKLLARNFQTWLSWYSRV